MSKMLQNVNVKNVFKNKCQKCSKKVCKKCQKMSM